jgi:hypothetical protein
MARRPAQPPINGYSVGARRVIDGRICCIACGEWKPADFEHFTDTGKRLAYRCRPCETERIFMHQMTQRIKKSGLLSEIAGIQAAERELERRKARLAQYIHKNQ